MPAPVAFPESMPLRHFLSTPLFSISGEAVTPGSILAGIFVIALTVLVARLVERGLKRLLAARGHTEGAQFAASKIVSYAIIALGSISAFNSMGLRLDAVLAASAVVLVGIGFGLQNIAQNFISGLILLIEQPVSKGDFVKVGDALGLVDDIGLRATTVVTRDHVTIIVPNSALVTGQVVNHSRPTHSLRVKIDVGVAYGTSPEKVRDVLLKVADEDWEVEKNPAPEVRLDAFGDSALSFCLLVWIPHPKEDLRASSRIRFSILKAFAEHGIVIPPPQREVHMKSS